MHRITPIPGLGRKQGSSYKVCQRLKKHLRLIPFFKVFGKLKQGRVTVCSAHKFEKTQQIRLHSPCRIPLGLKVAPEVGKPVRLPRITAAIDIPGYGLHQPGPRPAEGQNGRS